MIVDHGWRGNRAALLTLTEEVKEIEELAVSAGYEILYEIIQRRNRPHSSTFVGKGKLKELQKILLENPVDVLLINSDLRPSQHFCLESTLKVECMDRIGTVLEIFVQKARDKKAKLQVEKARLEYEIPFLREWIHNAKTGEHPGFLGAGEYQVDVYYNLIRRRMKKINDELILLGERQDLRRIQRRKRGFYLVSIAGYTNAGKSSLLRRLSGEEVVIDSRMFSTLSTITRRLEEVKKNILLTDTIGFLRNLPHFMVESFRTTIDDIFMSDLILLVVDGGDPIESILSKLDTSLRIISPPVEKRDMIVVLNKIDLTNCPEKIIGSIQERIPGISIFPISILEDTGIDDLKNAIVSAFRYSHALNFSAPNNPETANFVSFLYDHTEVRSIDYENEVRVSTNCRERDYGKILSKIEELNGKLLSADIR
jgi:GTPase